MTRTAFSILWVAFALPGVFSGNLTGQPAEKNGHVIYEVSQTGDEYLVHYRFLDPFNNLQDYHLRMPAAQTARMISQFGIPGWLFEPYVDTEYNRRMREEVVARGMFLIRDNIIEVDKRAVIEYYGETFCRPIAAMIASSLSEMGADTRRNRIEFAIRFVQDIPYGIPERGNDSIHYGGVFVPPQVLLKGYGDCDSKALLFAGILSHLIPAGDIVFLNQKEHVLTAVKGEAEDGMTVIRFRGDTYLLAETAGPGRRSLGQQGNYYRHEFRVETVGITPPEPIPAGDHSRAGQLQWHPEAPGSNVLLLLNDSPRRVHFDISPDSRKWERLRLEANQAGRYVFKGKAKVFLRVKDSNGKAITFRLDTGAAYTMRWNKRQKRWDIISS